MNVVKFLTKLYEGDSYLQAFLGKVAKDIEAGAPPIKAFADEAGRLSVVLGVQKANKEVAPPGQVAPVKRKVAVPVRKPSVEDKKSAAVKAEGLTVADESKPHRGRPTNAEKAARALLAKTVPDEGQAQVIKVGDQTTAGGRGRRNSSSGLPFVPEEAPTAGEISDSVLSMS
jgi:hypothetical protein